MTDKLVTYNVNGESFEILQSKVDEIEQTILPSKISLESITDRALDLFKLGESEENCNLAKQYLKELVKNRTLTEKNRVSTGFILLKTKKGIDAAFKGVIKENSELEVRVKDFAFAEDKREEKRIAALVLKRTELIYKLGDPSNYDLAKMTESAFADTIEMLELRAEKIQKEEQERILAEAKEEQRKELYTTRTNKLRPLWNFLDAEEKKIDFGTISEISFSDILDSCDNRKLDNDLKQAAINSENERLKKEVEEKDKLAKIEKDKQDKIIAQEREKREKIESELREKERADRLKLEKLEAARIAKEQAPDKEKLLNWLDSFNIEIPEFKNDRFKTIAILFKQHIETEINNSKSKL